MAGRTRGFLDELEASFDASVRREEDMAAGDLARSFRNDARLADVVARSGAGEIELSEGTRLSVTEVGIDYVLGGVNRDFLVHLDKAIFHVGATATDTVRTDRSWLNVAREWAVTGLKVQVRVHERTVEGVLVSAARDFLNVQGERGSVLVPHATISYLRSCPEG